MMATSCEEMKLPLVKQLAGKLSIEKKSMPVLAVSLAGTEEEVLQCQRLRYSIFAEEMGAMERFSCKMAIAPTASPSTSTPSMITRSTSSG